MVAVREERQDVPREEPTAGLWPLHQLQSRALDTRALSSGKMRDSSGSRRKVPSRSTKERPWEHL